MPIFSEYRAKLYEYALKQPRYDLANVTTTPPHLMQMICERSGRKTQLTNADIVDNLAPTFDEARKLDVLRASALRHALDLLDEGQDRIHKSSLVPEVTDFIYDKLPGGQPMYYFNLWDVIKALRPTAVEAREAEKPALELKQEWQGFLNSLTPPLSSDGTEWNDEDLDF
ncbi:hypothetical protein ACXYMP_09330 [Aliiroseovarius sp. CAU 1755]|nr:hypothetical protein [Aliiroseovarius sp. S1339]MCK8463078.1 hypothetical protein [Aliiroseovarius sp. S1339]